MQRFAAALAVIILMATGCHRGAPIRPQAIDDARLGVRVKTALVNDAELGPRIIEVRATRGVVSLSGIVGSEAEVERAVALVRAVEGVTDVRSQLIVQPPEARPPAVRNESPARGLAFQNR